jgi:uncharacterized protein YkwD
MTNRAGLRLAIFESSAVVLVLLFVGLSIESGLGDPGSDPSDQKQITRIISEGKSANPDPGLRVFVSEGAKPPQIGHRPQPTGSALLPSPMVFESRGDESFNPIIASAPQRTVPESSIPSTAAEADKAREVFVLTNNVRREAGLPELQWDEKLANSAKYHAADMETDLYFDHDSYDRVDGLLVRVRSAEERLKSFAPYGAGENIAQGQISAEEAMASWMASPPHRRGILREDISKLGVGLVGRTWVQNFGW